MTFSETPIAGAYTIDISPIHDVRGFFARAWSLEDFERAGLDPNVGARAGLCAVALSRSLNLPSVCG